MELGQAGGGGSEGGGDGIGGDGGGGCCYRWCGLCDIVVRKCGGVTVVT